MAYDKDKVFDIICDRISKGESLRSVLLDDYMPSSFTFYEWIKKDKEKGEKYAKASGNTKEYISKELYRSDNARKVNSKRFPNSNLYILKIRDQNIYKIGVSQNIKRRVRDIKASLPYESDLIGVFKFKNAYEIEDDIHNLLSEYKMRSEWFKLDIEDYLIIKDVVNKVSMYEQSNKAI